MTGCRGRWSVPGFLWITVPSKSIHHNPPFCNLKMHQIEHDSEICSSVYFPDSNYVILAIAGSTIKTRGCEKVDSKV